MAVSINAGNVLSSLKSGPIWGNLDGIKAFDCYGGKMLMASGLLILGVPREAIQTRFDQGCFARPSTDDYGTSPITFGMLSFKSECLDREIPSKACDKGFDCKDYPSEDVHPFHKPYCNGVTSSIPDAVSSNNPPPTNYLEYFNLTFIQGSPAENYIKVFQPSIDGIGWWAVSAVFPLRYPIYAGDGWMELYPGGFWVTSIGDRYARYQVMNENNGGKEQKWRIGNKYYPAPPFPGSPCPPPGSLP